MNSTFAVLFGVLPAFLLALLTIFPLLTGIAELFEDPAWGALSLAWAIAGLVGTRTLLKVYGGTYTEYTVLGLLAGIAAAAPLVWMILAAGGWPYILIPLYFTAGPIIVAAGYIAEMLLFESADDARIIEYEEA
ncbi:MAG: hypothetical protein QNJ14_16095 [Woeseiaceae bacterium]|nr:hypothetical protein [Woeseiaceae bacterium]